MLTFKKITLFVLLLTVFTIVFAEDLPELGSTYMIDKASFTVAGAGVQPFEYTATGESLQIVVGDIPGTMVIVPDAGKVVKVDPSVPMVWVDGEPHKEFVNNSYLKKHGKGVRYLLLEYNR